MNNTFGIICANYDLEDFGSLLDHRTISSLPFAGRYRMVDLPLTAMVRAGINAVGLIMPYYYRSLIDHVGTGKAWGLDRKVDGLFPLPGSIYSREDSGYKVHVGDIVTNHRFIERRPNDTNAVFMSTSYIYNVNLKPIIESHEKSGKKVTIVNKIREDGTKHFIDISIVSKDCLLDLMYKYRDRPYMSLIEALTDMLPKKDFNEYICKGYAKEIVTPADYFNVSMDILNPEVQANLFNPEREIITKTQDEAPTLYTKTAKVKNSFIATGCVIEGTVENCIIFRNVTVEKGAVLKNCILMQHTKVESNAKLTNVIADKYVTVSSKVVLQGNERPIILPKNERI